MRFNLQISIERFRWPSGTIHREGTKDMQLLVMGPVRMPWKLSFENHGHESIVPMACYLDWQELEVN